MDTTSNANPRLLNSWKQIANYLGCSVRTAQRWERSFALPVHHPSNSLRGPVLAQPHELDGWVARAHRRRLKTPDAAHSQHFARTLSLFERTTANTDRLVKMAGRLYQQVQRTDMLIKSPGTTMVLAKARHSEAANRSAAAPSSGLEDKILEPVLRQRSL